MSRTRWTLTALVCLIALLPLACQTTTTTTPAPAPAPAGVAPRAAEMGVANCAANPGNNTGPIVAVTVTGSAPNQTLTINPDPVHGAKHQVGGGAVTIRWCTPNGNTLTITPTGSCITGLSCSGGQCTATMNNSAAGGTQCKYTANVDGISVDPVIVVDECCP